jgi:large subunit ribosomal protein L21
LQFFEKIATFAPSFSSHTQIMYAIVEIAGQQFKIQKGRSIYTHRLAGDVDAALASDQIKVLLVDNEGTISVGAPVVEGASVSAKIVEHLKGEKVIVFKKKRRKGYKKKNGHRQYLTKLQIEDITL